MRSSQKTKYNIQQYFRTYIKGVLHPGQFLDCFYNFLKNYNTMVTSKICFL